MPAYATFDQLLARVGSLRSLERSPSSDTSPQDFWEERLLSASGEMDTFFRRQGYVLPFDVIGSPDPSTQAKLASICVELTCEEAGIGQIALGDGVKSAADQARIWLDKVAAGVLRLPWPLALQTSFASINRPERGPSEPFVPFDDRLFDRSATV